MTGPSASNINIDLFRRIAQDDTAAFEMLFKQTKEQVYALAKKLLKEPYLAEEVVQDIFTIVWRKRAELANIQSPDAYLYRLTKNRSIDMLRRISTENRAKNELWQQLADQQLMEPLVNTGELESLIQKAIEKLPPKRKEIFLLSRNSTLSYEAIAIRTGVSKNTVKTHLLLAVREIKKYLMVYRNLYWLLPMITIF